MHAQSRMFCLTVSVAVAGILANAMLPSPAASRPAAPAGAGQPAVSQADPPARVGRIASVTGTSSVRTAADTQWAPAGLNYPVSAGNAFWADDNSRVGLEIGSSRLVLAPLTELDVATLDAGGLQATVPQGEVYLHLRNLAPGETWTLQTPRGAVRFGQPGHYGIQIGSTQAPTLVTVIDGAAQIEAPGMSLTVGANETATIDGTDTFQGRVGPAVRDAFLAEQMAAEQPRRVVSLPPPVAAQVAQMPGGSDLYDTGDWADVPEYGHVWYPPVAAGWAPYRNGHWAWVAPWGWTWIDDAPWGFAPFHYGRWVEVGGRWAWTPGARVPPPGPTPPPAPPPPVYAPALVTFVGVGAGAAAGAALAAGHVGWIPLGPHEPYRPWYRASSGYDQRMNAWAGGGAPPAPGGAGNVNAFMNRGATTVVPAGVMIGSRPVQPAAQPVSPAQLAGARPVIGQPPVRPAMSTAGVTPAVARELSLPPALPGTMRVAPGPAVLRPQGFTAGPGGQPVRPIVPAVPGTRPAPVAAGVAVPHLPGQLPPGVGAAGPAGAGRGGAAGEPARWSPGGQPDESAGWWFDRPSGRRTDGSARSWPNRCSGWRASHPARGWPDRAPGGDALWWPVPRWFAPRWFATGRSATGRSAAGWHAGWAARRWAHRSAGGWLGGRSSGNRCKWSAARRSDRSAGRAAARRWPRRSTKWRPGRCSRHRCDQSARGRPGRAAGRPWAAADSRRTLSDRGGAVRTRAGFALSARNDRAGAGRFGRRTNPADRSAR